MNSIRTFVAALLVLASLSVSAQNFPSKPIRIIVPFGAGAMVDAIPRDIASELSKKLGQPVIVENKPGAASMVGAEYVAKSPADGHTLLMATSSTLSVAPYLYRNLPFDPLHDLAPLTLVGTAPNVLMVSSQLPVKSVGELVAMAKAKPGELSFASAGVGGILHLQAENFLAHTKTQMIHAPYTGSQQAIADLATNRVQLMIDILASNYGNLQGGKLKPLAVMTSERIPQLPGIPTIAEAGYPALAADMWFGLALPAKTPPAVVALLNKEITAIIDSPAMRSKYGALGMNMRGSTPTEMGELVKRDGERWSGVIRSANVKVE